MSIRNLKISLFVIIMTILGQSKVHAAQFNYKPHPIKINGCPANLIINLPENFRTPSNDSEKNTHDLVLQGLHSNKNRKTVYSNIFLTNWQVLEEFPQVAVGSLGSLSNMQGRVSKENWKELKRNFISISEPKWNEIAKTGSNKLLENNPDI